MSASRASHILKTFLWQMYCFHGVNLWIAVGFRTYCNTLLLVPGVNNKHATVSSQIFKIWFHLKHIDTCPHFLTGPSLVLCSSSNTVWSTPFSSNYVIRTATHRNQHVCVRELKHPGEKVPPWRRYTSNSCQQIQLWSCSCVIPQRTLYVVFPH